MEKVQEILQKDRQALRKQLSEAQESELLDLLSCAAQDNYLDGEKIVIVPDWFGFCGFGMTQGLVYLEKQGASVDIAAENGQMAGAEPLDEKLSERVMDIARRHIEEILTEEPPAWIL